MRISVDSDGFRRWHEAGKGQAPPADTQIVTSDGYRIAAHSHVLASASPVLESMVYGARKNWNSERAIQILGVPSDAVFAFLYSIYSSSTALSSAEGKEVMEKYGVQLLVLAHKYRIGWLKRGCEIEVGRHLKPKSAIDVLQIARLCDASRLYQTCLRLMSKDFDSVLKSDAWRFVQKNDPGLELQILRFLRETELREKRWERERSDQEMYRQLSEAMECLEHICVEGCTNVGPLDRAPPTKSKGPCTEFQPCEGLQLLIRHFATCSTKKDIPGRGRACTHCKRMRQLFRLHSSLCDRSGCCRVPLCKQFKLRVQMDPGGDDAAWGLLVKRVAVARAMCSLARRKRPEQLHNLWARHHAEGGADTSSPTTVGLGIEMEPRTATKPMDLRHPSQFGTVAVINPEYFDQTKGASICDSDQK